MGKLGQVGISLDKAIKRKIGKKAERIRKENKNLSGDGEGGGGEGFRGINKYFNIYENILFSKDTYLVR